jgi:ABC-type cobalamin/Fe3+-siderophores transport system ATPase subunit
MAHITRIRIEGLLGRELPIEMTLDRTVNVFFGENGCGKTTLLKILQSALSQDGDAMISLPVERAEVDIYSVTDERVIPHIWDRKNIARKHELPMEMLRSMRERDLTMFEQVQYMSLRNSVSEWKVVGSKRSKDQKRRSWAHCFLPTTRLYNTDSGRRSPEQRSNTEDRLNEAFAESVNKRWLLYYTQILQEVRNIQEEGLRAVLYHSLSLASDAPTGPTLNPEQAYERVKKFLARQSSQDAGLLGSTKVFAGRYATDEALRRVVDNINNVESRIEASMAPIHKFTGTIDSLFSRNKRLKTLDNGLAVALEDGKIITPAQLSSGEKHLLVILLNAMTADQNSVIVDEPELSMHIDWQHALTETIARLNPRCQLILASHSPEIMANVQDQKIFRI